jgi:uncharacterized protein
MPPITFQVALRGDAAVTAVLYPAAAGEADARLLILAHGAGAGQQSPFITGYAQGLAARGTHVATFNFPYMEQRGRGAPDRAPVLEETFRDTVSGITSRPDLADARVFVGGKSMGGRMATHLAAAPGAWPVPQPLAGAVVFGYPLQPPGPPRLDRAAHLHHLAAPTLVVQGTRDRFGGPDAIRAATAGAANLEVFPVEGGDHSFVVLKRSGRDQEAVHREIWDGVTEWMRRRSVGAARH